MEVWNDRVLLMYSRGVPSSDADRQIILSERSYIWAIEVSTELKWNLLGWSRVSHVIGGLSPSTLI
jgi:hypothetical protein